jgi:hypothetical protein
MFRENVAALREESQQKLIVSKRGQLIEELKLGIWTKEEYIKQVAALEGNVVDEENHSSKRQRTREDLPPWDIQDDDFTGNSGLSQSVGDA